MTNPVIALSCTNCGTALQPDERFCPACGTPTPLGAEADAIDAVPARSPWAQIVAQLQAATVGEFEISRELGRGGMAAVYLAHEIALNRLVAIKVMAPGLFLGPGMVDRFRQEAVTVANLSHPNIITIHGVRQVDDLHFLVMKFVEGQSLEAVLATTGRLPVAAVRAILFQVGSGLAYAHRRGVIHRDVKPANVLLDADGNAIVTDFGIAKLAEVKGQTQTGTMVGTPAYMSPEQCYGGELTWASDLYALGVVAFELLTGTVPFTGSTFKVLQAHTVTPPPGLRDLRPDCPAELESAVLRMLAKEPEARFPSMAEALNALGAAPLSEGDPLRDELAHLAVPDPSARAQTAIQPALSPRPQTGPRVGRLAIFGAPDIVAVGDRFALRTEVRSDVGASVDGRAVSWSSSDHDIASVTANGEVTARAPGRVNITATCEGVLASLPLRVQPPSSGARRPARHGMLWGSAAAAVLLAAGAAAYFSRGPTERTASPPPPTSKALAPQAKDTAAIAAPVAAAPTPTPAARDTTTRTRARRDSIRPRVATAPVTPPVTERKADSTPIEPSPAPASNPPIDTTPAHQAPAPVLPPPDYTPGIRAAVAAWVDAINARSLPGMRVVFPGLSGELARDWQGLFGNDVAGVHVAASQVEITSSDELADARFSLLLTFTPRGGDQQSRSIASHATLRRLGTVWHFLTLEQRAAGR